MEDVPEFRKNLTVLADVEGVGALRRRVRRGSWPDKDPYSKFGNCRTKCGARCDLLSILACIRWAGRACKLIDYFRENTSKTDQDIIVEVERYIVWPGQSLAYKLGQLKFRELRARAQDSLGDRFDIRTFHDAVLEQGAVPLDLLEAHMNASAGRASHRAGKALKNGTGPRAR